jgi:ring-1,2-phenylacetyl-CoA epoxidase subunit PaaD
VLEALRVVVDPEIPTVSLVDLGVVSDVEVKADGQIRVELTPTFAGCPAIQLMRMEAAVVLEQAGWPNAEVVINHNRAWSSDDITPQGIEGLRKHGLAPPPRVLQTDDLQTLMQAECPKCASINTQMMSPFGPTLCRAIHHCNDCHETFEQFKPL